MTSLADAQLAASADAALQRVLTPGGAPIRRPSGSAVVDALVSAAHATGLRVSQERIDLTRREGVTDVAVAARRLRVPAREVRLTGNWWKAAASPMVVQTVAGPRAGADTDDPGTLWAAVPKGNSYLLLCAHQQRRVDAQLAAQVTRAWTITPALPARPARLREVLALGMRGTGRDLALMLAATVGIGLLGVVVPIASGAIVGSLVPQAATGRILAVGLLVILAVLVNAGLGLFQGVILARMTTRMDSRNTAIILERVLALPMSFFRGIQSGDLLSRIQGFDQLSGALSRSLLRLASSAMLAASGLYVMMRVQPGLGLVVLSVLLVAGAVAAATLAWQGRARTRYIKASLKLSGSTLSLFSGISKIRVAGAESRMNSLWTLDYARQQVASRDVALGNQRLALLAAATPAVVTVVVVAGSLDSALGSELGRFTTFVTASGQAAGACAGMLAPMAALFATLPLLRMLRPVLEVTPEVAPTATDPGELTGEVELVRASFGYDPEAPPVIRNVSLRVAPGEFVAVVGPSGAGKSTLVRLMIGLDAPTSGDVRYDGKSLERIDSAALRRQIGVVTQSAQLASGSLLQNIIGSSALTEADAWLAAERAGIAADIRAMPMGMQTLVSDGAATFSGGQKQRILLARALVRKPRILVLDEATSALDNATQAAVAESLEALGATRIVVAHRLSTIRNADRIIVVEGGQVVEQGSYEELVNAGGVFARLVARQVAT